MEFCIFSFPQLSIGSLVFDREIDMGAHTHDGCVILTRLAMAARLPSESTPEVRSTEYCRVRRITVTRARLRGRIPPVGPVGSTLTSGPRLSQWGPDYLGIFRGRMWTHENPGTDPNVVLPRHPCLGRVCLCLSTDHHVSSWATLRRVVSSIPITPQPLTPNRQQHG